MLCEFIQISPTDYKCINCGFIVRGITVGHPLIKCNSTKPKLQSNIVPCQSRLVQTDTKICELCGAKGKTIGVYHCSLHKECTETRYSLNQPEKVCLDCKDYSPINSENLPMPLDLFNYFDRVYCINLDKRKDRWEQFTNNLPSDWPFKTPIRVSAIDGTLCPPAPWWPVSKGAWGCYRTHLQLIEDALNKGYERVLFLEDDAICLPNFTERVQTYLEALPIDWQMVYLGGQYLTAQKNPPIKVNSQVFIPHNVNRTHAYALQGRASFVKVYQHLMNYKDWHHRQHIDHRYGYLHETRQIKVYSPHTWLIGQNESSSDVRDDHHNFPTRYWDSAYKFSDNPLDWVPFIVVLGLHSSGSSCLAGVLYHLGIHLGDDLTGYYGNDPNTTCGFEAKGLLNLCESVIPFPQTIKQKSNQEIIDLLRKWINARKKEAVNKRTMAGGKYPMLCQLGDELACATDDLRIIAIDRPIEDSIKSIIKRCPNRSPDDLAKHQQWLNQGKEATLAKTAPDKFLRINYYELLNNPQESIFKILSFLKYSPAQTAIDRAIAYVRPQLAHILPSSP